MPNLGFRLKEPAIAGYTYNPSKPPFEKEGLVVSLAAYLTEGENYYESISIATLRLNLLRVRISMEQYLLLACGLVGREG